MNPLDFHRRGASRPAPGAWVDRRWPVCRGLIGAFLFGDGGGSMVFDSMNRVGPAPLTAVSRGNNGLVFADASTIRYARWAQPMSGFDRSRGTVLVLFRARGTQGSNGTNNHGDMWSVENFPLTTLGLTGTNPATACLQWRWKTDFADPSQIVGTTPVGSRRWRVAVVTFEDGDHRLYLDGRLEGTAALSGSYDDADVLIGTNALNGQIVGDVSLSLWWDRPLTASEVRQLAADPYLPWRAGLGWSYGSFTTYSALLRGSHSRHEGFGTTQRGVARVGYLSYTASMRGTSSLLTSFGHCLQGESRVAYDSYRSTARGSFRLNNEFGVVMRGTSSLLQLFTFESNLRGAGRIANDALERYELYHGVNAEPDFAAAAEATFTGSSHLSSVLSYPATHYFTVRRRNKYGLVSQNVASWSVTLDASGLAVLSAPSAPTGVSAAASGSGRVTLRALYHYRGDGPAQGDQWLVYERTNGTDPVVGVDTPVVVSMTKADGLAQLERDVTGLSGGTVYKAIVRVRRSSPSADSASSPVVTATAVTSPALAITGRGGHIGTELTQKQ